MAQTPEERVAVTEAEQVARLARREARAFRGNRRYTLLEHVVDQNDDFEDGLDEEEEAERDSFTMDDLDQEYARNKEALLEGINNALGNLENARGVYADLVEKSENQSAELKNLQRRYNDLVNGSHNDDDQLTSLTAQIDNTTQECTAAKDELAAVTSTKDALVAQAVQLLTKIKHLEKEKLSSGVILQNIDAERAGVLSQLRAAEDDVLKAKSDIQDLKKDKVILENGVAMQKRLYLEAMGEFDRVNTELTKARADAAIAIATAVPTTQTQVDVSATAAKNVQLGEQVASLLAEMKLVKESRFGSATAPITLPILTPSNSQRGRTSSRTTRRSTRSRSASHHSPQGGREPHAKEPSPLTDGKEPKYDNWNKAMRTYFTMRFQSFSSDKMKMGAIYNCTGGVAQRRLAPRYLSDDHPYRTSAEMFADLKNAFVDPNLQENAKTVLEGTLMEEDETFYHFEQTFHELASDSKKPAASWRQDLLDKVTDTLQSECIVSRDLYPTYEGIKGHLEIIDQRIRMMKQKTAARTPARTPARTTARPKSPFPAPASVRPSAAPARTSASLPFVRSTTPALAGETRTCFTCKKPGHISRDCRDLRTTVAEMTGTQAIDYMTEAEAAEGAEDSGNARA